jgi:hypothetical protein
MTDRPRNIANDMLDAVETATSKWTRQKKSEERHPGNIRYRASRMTREPRTTQKEAAWEVMEQAYMAARGGGALPALARQIFYQARPKIMAMTDDKELQYGYFSQTLLPDYIEEHGVDWNVVYDARGPFENSPVDRVADPQGAPWGWATNRSPNPALPRKRERCGDQAWGSRHDS